MKRSYLWAGLFAAAMAGWLASGQMASTSEDSAPADKPAAAETEQKPFRVVVDTFTSQPRQRVVTLRGRTESHKTLDVLVRTAGIVEQSPAREGDEVKAGDLLCRLDMSDRAARLAQARATLASAKRDYEAAAKLVGKKYVSQAKVASEKARLDAAMAAIEQIGLDIKWTEVRAPIAGILNARPAEVGRFLKVAEPCAQIAVLDPIVAVGQVAERDVADVRTGQPARIKLVTGEAMDGTIRFIAPQADLATRTFKVEIEAPNPDKRIRAGITAAIDIPLDAIRAHLLPSALVSLDDDGITGAYAVDEDNKVVFHPLNLIALTRDGAWVTGLPDEVTLITVGQHYVLPDQTVETVRQQDAGS